MDGQVIFELYGINVEKQLSLNQFEAGDYQFQFVSANDQTEEEIYERMQLANHLHGRGEAGVFIPIQKRDGSFFTSHNGMNQVLLGLASRVSAAAVSGRDLAAFHYRGRGTNSSQLKRMGEWKTMWEQRTDQMERFWQGKCYTTPQNDFEKLFVDNFPYYLGMMENAIQYLGDAGLANQEEDEIATICHERFGDACFQSGKNPLAWVLDHPSRDLAEWVRDQYFSMPNTYHYSVKQFMQEYSRALPLSPYSFQLIYARLLFPVHFFEAVEGYYTVSSEDVKRRLEERLAVDVKNSQYYEQFLKEFFELAGIQGSNSTIRIPEWLRR